MVEAANIQVTQGDTASLAFTVTDDGGTGLSTATVRWNCRRPQTSTTNALELATGGSGVTVSGSGPWTVNVTLTDEQTAALSVTDPSRIYYYNLEAEESGGGTIAQLFGGTLTVYATGSAQGSSGTVTASGFVPAGGTSGQVLGKQSNADYDFDWQNSAQASNGLPAGGTAGQSLTKVDGTDYNAEWTTISGGGSLPSGGTAGQVLRKTSATDGDAAWAVPIIGEISGLQAALDAKQDSSSAFDGAYGSLSGTPSTFAPSAHTHPISEVTGLQAALDAKRDDTDPALPDPSASTQGYVPKVNATLDGYELLPDSDTGGGGSLPTGGTAGQYLRKTSGTDGDAAFADVAISEVSGLQTALDAKAATAQAQPTGGTAGQFLRKTSGTNYDAAYAAPAISEVTGLQTALDAKADDAATTSALAGKADTSHTHPQSDITDLIADLAAKADAAVSIAQQRYASRAAAEAANVPAAVEYLVVKHDDMDLPYVRQTGATALTTGDGAKWAPAGTPTVAHYGALNDSTFDSTAAINAAIAAHDIVHVPTTIDNGNVGGSPGYRLDDPILMREGVTLYGNGPNHSWIRANTALGDQPMIARPDWDSVTSDTDAGVGNITIRGIQIRDNTSITRTNTWTIDLTNSNANLFESIHLVGNADPVAGAQLHGIAVGRRWDSAFSGSSAWVHVFDNVELTGAKLLINGSDSNIQDCKLFSFGKDYCVRIGASQVDILGSIVTGGSVEGGIFISGDSQAGTLRHITVNSTFMDGGSVNDRVGLRHIYAPSTQSIEECQFIQNDGFNHGREVIRLEAAHNCTVMGNHGREADNYDAGLSDIYVKGTNNTVLANHFERGSTCFKSGTFGTVEARANLGHSIEVVDDDGASGVTAVAYNRANGAGYSDTPNTEEFNTKRIGPIGSGATDGSTTWLMELLAEALRITAPGTDRLELDGRMVVAATAAQLATAAAATSDESLVLHNQGANHIALTGGNDDWGINVDGSGNLRLARRSGIGEVDIGNVGVSPGGSISVQSNAVIDSLRGVRLRSYTATELDDIADAVNTGNKVAGKIVWDSTAGTVAVASGSLAADSWTRLEKDGHTHVIGDTTGLQTALDGKVDLAGDTMTGALAMGSNKVTGVADGTAAGDAVNKGQLDGKADTSHTHTIANVTGLQTELDGKPDSSAINTITTLTQAAYDALTPDANTLYLING